MTSYDSSVAPSPKTSEEKTTILTYTTNEFHYKVAAKHDSKPSRFDSEVAEKWEKARHEKAMNYDLNLLFKLLPGKFNLAAVLNMERGQLRRKPLSHRTMNDPFDRRRFNFTKIKSKEILFDLRCTDEPLTDDKLDRHLLITNQAPVDSKHCLIVPYIQRCLPQIMTLEGFRLALDLMLLSGSPHFKIAYNSLLAHASVNHFHLHSFYWSYDIQLSQTPVESVGGDLYMIKCPEWYMPCFVFQITNPAHKNRVICSVMEVFYYFQRATVAHHLIMGRAPCLRKDTGEAWDPKADSGPKKGQDQLLYPTIYITPRRSVFGSKPVSSFSPAAMELAGMILVYTFQFFRFMTEEAIVRHIEDEAKFVGNEFENFVNELKPTMEEIVNNN